MPLSNPEKIREIAFKISNHFDNKYCDYLEGRSTSYIHGLTELNNIQHHIGLSLNNEEKIIFFKALSEDEVEVQKIFIEKFKLTSFTKKILDDHINGMPKIIVDLYAKIKEEEKIKLKSSKQQEEYLTMFKSCKLTRRQKQILNSIGVPIAKFESKPLV